MSITTTYAVDGMTCSHCVNAVVGELSAIEGVLAVHVDLVVDAASTVRVSSQAPLDREVVGDAVEEAGYQLA